MGVGGSKKYESKETQIFETTSFLTGISSAPEGKPIIKHSNN